MPELPEVETIRRGLAAALPGKTITKTDVRLAKILQGDPASLAGVTIQAVQRRGKLLLIELVDGRTLAIHLKMTGQLLFKDAAGGLVMGGHPAQSYLDQLPNKHTRVVFHFSDGSLLYFNDLRTFGYVQIMTAEELREYRFLATLGPEPFSPDFSVAYLRHQLAQSRVAIKSFLLDQVKIAGLGNIYADESLFRAGIHPTRQATSLTPKEVSQLVAAIQQTLTVALEHGGSSERDYLNAIGEKGTYLHVAQVYHRTGQPCPRCPGHSIQRIKVGGRSTHFCSNCQH